MREADAGAPARTPIAALLARGEVGAHVRVHGWVRTRRDSKGFSFLELNDGSSMAGLQVVVDHDTPGWAEGEAGLNTGAAVVAVGELAASPGKGQAVELQARRVTLAGEAGPDYPLQKKRHSFEYLRSIAHLRVRSNTFGAVARVRNALFMAVHSFFQQRGFVFLPAPIITASDAEGAGEMFRVTTLDLANVPRRQHGAQGGEGAAGSGGDGVDWAQDFFGTQAGLTVSGQLQAEAFAQAFHDVYTFGPTFRAENSNTSRHAAEFWMIEPECAFADLGAIRELAEAFLKEVITAARQQCEADFAFFDQRIEPGLLARLDHVLDSPFETVTYTEAVRMLEASGERFEYPVGWGHDLQSEHERWLTEKKVGRPLFVVDYPADIKAFYMRLNEDERTVAALDLLVPAVGEIIGGSQREERTGVLRRRMAERGMPVEDYEWYLDLRRFGSTVHSGFGVGFERLLMYLTGLGNIRDVIPFPRTPGNAAF